MGVVFSRRFFPLIALSVVAVLISTAGCTVTLESPTPSLVNPIKQLEDSLVFHPTSLPKGDWKPKDLPGEEANFEAADGTKLHGWYVAQADPRAVVLFAHGNAGNLADRAGLVKYLHDCHGLSVMIFDYRGFGKSEGKPDEAGILQDARAARKWLAKKANIREQDIVLMGRSLGGGVMVDLAANDGARGLILQSTFTSLPDVAATMPGAGVLRFAMKNRLDSLSKIDRYRGPLLQSHGDADTIVPFKLGKKLYDKANEPKQFITIQGRNHNDPQDASYYRALDRFLDFLNAQN